jgi:hypothetical protein
MTDRTSIQEELHGLRSQLEDRSRSDEPHERGGAEDLPFTAPAEADPTELEAHVADLRRVLLELTANAEQVVAEHPMISVLSAFLLGVAVGRMTGRS